MKRNEIVDYEVKDSDGNVTETLPMLVVHVNDQDNGDGSVIGTVFQTNGTTRAVTFNPADEQAAKDEAKSRDDYESWKSSQQSAPPVQDPAGDHLNLGGNQ